MIYIVLLIVAFAGLGCVDDVVDYVWNKIGA